MILSTCIIVGHDGELNSLKRCIDSFKDYTEEIIVTANGKEVKEIEKYCKTEPKIKYFFHEWTKDFADQRNFCASKVRKDADYYFWVDADDVIVGVEHLRPIAERAKKVKLDAIFFTYWYGCYFEGEPSVETMKKVELTQIRERLMKPGTTIWKNRLHETPVPQANIDFTHSTVEYSQENPIAWLHLGVNRNTPQEESESKTARNRELLELQLEDERKAGNVDPRTLIYLMKIYGEEEDKETLEETINMGYEYLLKSGWDAERAAACCIIGKSLSKLGREDEAKQFLFKSIQEYPYDPILYLHLSRVCGNLKQYSQMKHWLEIALSLDLGKSASSVTNLLELKLLSSELAMHYYYNAERNIHKAFKAMKMLYEELPSAENKEAYEYLKKIYDLEIASEQANKLVLYYQEHNNSDGIVKLIDSMPQNMRNLPFARAMYNKHKEPRVWGQKEICYYASFGKPHLEHWDGRDLARGLGGSETAVIRLSEEWAKNGWKVTVYGDPKEPVVINGVTYLPFYEFNTRDYFNIFINWRSAFLVDRIKCKKFLVDFHDLLNVNQYLEHQYSVDKFMVKSNFHAELLQGVGVERIGIVSNGI